MCHFCRTLPTTLNPGQSTSTTQGFHYPISPHSTCLAIFFICSTAAPHMAPLPHYPKIELAKLRRNINTHKAPKPNVNRVPLAPGLQRPRVPCASTSVSAESSPRGPALDVRTRQARAQKRHRSGEHSHRGARRRRSPANTREPPLRVCRRYSTSVSTSYR